MSFLFAATTIIALWSGAATAQRHDAVVFLVNAKSAVRKLSSVETHKLFGGLPVSVDGRSLRALRNESDPMLAQIFLQNIVSMSETTYRRRVRELDLQRPGSQLPPVHSTHDLLRSIAADIDIVSFAWASEVGGTPGIRILGVIWQD